MTGLSLRNPIAILMLCIAVVVFAWVVTPRMSVDTFPELTPPVLIIGEVAPGLAAKDVEKAVAWRIERYVAATTGVDHVESLSRNNFALVYVWLKWGTDLTAAQTLVQAEAAFAMAGAPKSLGLLPPFVLPYDPSNAPVCQIVITGSGYSGSQLYDYAQNYVEPQIEGIDGVGSAPVDGGRPRQINVVVNPVAAQARHVTAEDIAAAVGRSNALLPSGEFIARDFDANVYTNGVPRAVTTIGEGTVKVVGDKPVLIRDVARVEDSGMPETQAVSVGGKDAVYLNVLRIPGGNTIKIVDAVKAKVAGLDNLPPGMEAHVLFDQSGFVRTTYDGLQREIVQALVLIALVILLFLQSLRGTLIVSVAIPLSFAITLIVLYATGQTLNAFTLGGLTLAMGRLVDDAVVVLESIHHHARDQKLRGEPADPARAAYEGATAVALAGARLHADDDGGALAGAPPRRPRQAALFAPLALTVAVAMIASYFVSMAVTPVACRYFLGHASRQLAVVSRALIARLAGGYAGLLRAHLAGAPQHRHRLGLLVLASVVAASRLPTSFFPDIDEAMDMAYVRFPPGMSVKAASATLAEMGKAITRELPEGSVEHGRHQRRHAAGAAQPPRQPERRAEHRLPPARLLADGGAQDVAGRAVGEDPRDPHPRVPRRRGDAVPGRARRQRLRQRLHRAAGRRAGERQPRRARCPDPRGRRGGAQRRRRPRCPRVAADGVPRGARRRRPRALGARRHLATDAAQTTLEATTGNINTPGVWVDAANGRAYYVVTFYDPATRLRHQRARQPAGALRVEGSTGPPRRLQPGESAGRRRRRGAQPHDPRRSRAHADRRARPRLGGERARRRARQRSAHAEPEVQASSGRWT